MKELTNLSLSQSFTDGSIHLSHTNWLVSPSQLTVFPKIYLAIASNMFGKFTRRRKRRKHYINIGFMKHFWRF